MNSAFKEGTQGGCNDQGRFSANFQAPYVRGVHKNERFARSLAILQSQMNFFQKLNGECVDKSMYLLCKHH